MIGLHVLHLSGDGFVLEHYRRGGMCHEYHVGLAGFHAGGHCGEVSSNLGAFDARAGELHHYGVLAEDFHSLVGCDGEGKCYGVEARIKGGVELAGSALDLHVVGAAALDYIDSSLAILAGGAFILHIVAVVADQRHFSSGYRVALTVDYCRRECAGLNCQCHMQHRILLRIRIPG